MSDQPDPYAPPSGGGPPPQQPPAAPPPSQPPQYGQPQYGQPPPYGQPQYGQQYYGAQPGTNGFAIASLVCAFVCAPLGIIFGFVAHSQIKRTGQSGTGLATAGIIVSAVSIVIAIIAFAVAASHTTTGPTPIGMEQFRATLLSQVLR